MMGRLIVFVLAAVLLVAGSDASAGGRFTRKGRRAVVRTAVRAGRMVRAPGIKLMKVGVYATGALADRVGGRLSRRGNSRMVRKFGLGLRHFLGTQTLKHTSFEAGFGTAFTTPRLVAFANVGVSTSMWTGSVAYWEASNNRSTDVHWNMNAGVQTFVGGAGYSKLQGPWRSIRLPWLSFSDSKRGYGAGIGLMNILTLNVGEIFATKEGEWDRGAFLNAGMSFPFFFIRIGTGARIFYPPLNRLVRQIRPMAETATPIQKHLEYHLIRRLYAAVFRRPKPARPPAGALGKVPLIRRFIRDTPAEKNTDD